MARLAPILRGAEQTTVAKVNMLEAIKRAIEQKPACTDAREARDSLSRANSHHEKVARRGWLLLEGETNPTCAGELPTP